MFKKNRKIWICGYHSSMAALNNKKRKHIILIITQTFYDKHTTLINNIKKSTPIQIVNKETITKLFPKNTAHQNIALKTSEISEYSLQEIIGIQSTFSTILALDQVTDVGNIGAILRSSAAFRIDTIILTKKNSPNKSAISKAASGSLESVPLIYVSNLVTSIKYLQKNGYWSYGMDERATKTLHKISFNKKTLIVLGSEKSGMRNLTKKNCDEIIKISTSDNISSLNVASAAAITLYTRYTQLIAK